MKKRPSKCASTTQAPLTVLSIFPLLFNGISSKKTTFFESLYSGTCCVILFHEFSFVSKRFRWFVRQMSVIDFTFPSAISEEPLRPDGFSGFFNKLWSISSNSIRWPCNLIWKSIRPSWIINLLRNVPRPLYGMHDLSLQRNVSHSFQGFPVTFATVFP